MQGTVNPSSYDFVGSSPTAPILRPEADSGQSPTPPKTQITRTLSVITRGNSSSFFSLHPLPFSLTTLAALTNRPHNAVRSLLLANNRQKISFFGVDHIDHSLYSGSSDGDQIGSSVRKFPVNIGLNTDKLRIVCCHGLSNSCVSGLRPTKSWDYASFALFLSLFFLLFFHPLHREVPNGPYCVPIPEKRKERSIRCRGSSPRI